jgi:selenophosphate synthase
VLGQLAPAEHPPEILVSSDTGDDAAVYQLPDGSGLVQTVDFFTPIVDDPFDWGRIAAANAVSDVYAMGGRPVLALNLVAWPVDELPLDLLFRVLEGGAKVAAEVDASRVPLLPGTLEMATDDVIPGGTRKNRTFIHPHVDWGDLSEPERLVLSDAQTSGGLLIAASENRAEPLREGLVSRGVEAAEIGRTTPGTPGHIAIRGRRTGPEG